jgi:hypothetical protein
MASFYDWLGVKKSQGIRLAVMHVETVPQRDGR